MEDKRTQFAKLMEFCYRIDMTNKMNKLGAFNETQTLIYYLSILAIEHDWDVEAALEEMRERLREDKLDDSVREFDPREFLEGQLEGIWKVRNKSPEEINERYFNFDLDNGKKPPYEPPEPGM